MKSRKLLFIVSALTCVSARAEVLDTIEVFAPRFPETEAPEGLPFSTVLRGDELQEAAMPSTDLRSLLNVVPNAYVSGNNSVGFTLRGLGQEGMLPTLGTASNPSVNVIRDGIPLSFNAVTYLSPLAGDLESMEVANGPQNFSTGGSSIGGAIRFSSAAPEFAPHGGATAETGEYGYFRGHLFQSIPLVDQELTMRFSYEYQEMDGSLDNVTLHDHEFGSTIRQRYATGLLWRPGGKGNDFVTLNVGYDRARGNPLASAVSMAGISDDVFERKTARNTNPSSPADHWSASLKGFFELPQDLTLTSISTVQSLDVDKLLDLDTSPYLNWYSYGFNDEFRVTQDILLERKGDRLDWTLGGYFEHGQYDTGYHGVGIAPLPFGSPFSTSLDEEVTKAAAFGRVQWKPHVDWRLGAGLRAVQEEREFSGDTRFFGFARAGDGESEDNALLPEIDLSWIPDETTLVGLRVGRGFRGGGVSYAPTLGSIGTYDPESSWDVELHAAARPHEEVSVSANLFYSRISDQQVVFTPAGGIPSIDQMISNASESRRYGAEAEIRWKPVDMFTWRASLGWLNTEYKELELEGMDLSGSRFANAPELTASVGLDFRHPSGWFASSLFTWADSSFSTIQQPSLTALEARKLLSAKIGYAWDHASVYVFGSNLLDEQAAVARSAGAVVPSINAELVAPRMIGVGCSVEW